MVIEFLISFSIWFSKRCVGERGEDACFKRDVILRTGWATKDAAI